MNQSDYFELTLNDVQKICKVMLHCDRSLSSLTISRRCAAVFGIRPKIIFFLWLSLEGLVPRRTTPNHLLWALSFLKLYEVEEARACRLHVDEKTCRKWTSTLVTAISKLNLVSNFKIPSFRI